MNLISVSQDILKMAAQNKASYRNKLPDAIHVATALESGCDIFVTNDASIKVPTNVNKLILKDLIID